MDFTFTDEHNSLGDAVRELAARHQGAQTGSPTPGDAAHDATLWAAMAATGLLGLPFAEDVGGMGAGPVEVMIAAAELGRAGLRTAYADALVAGTLIADSDTPSGDPATAKQLLGGISDGTLLVLPALSIPGGVDAGISLRDGALTGVREPVPGLSFATHVVVPVPGSGLFVVADPPHTGSSRLALSDTAAEALGGPGELSHAVVRATNLGLLAVCAEALGAMESALAMTVEYLKTRKQFGRPLGSFQTLTQRAADMYTSVELARSTVHFAAMSLVEDPADATTMSRTKVVVGKAGRLVGQEAIQLHGGIGMTAEYAVGHLTARLTAIEHTYGDTRTHLGALGRAVGSYEGVEVLR